MPRFRVNPFPRGSDLYRPIDGYKDVAGTTWDMRLIIHDDDI
jgi:hypothetical protein